MNLIKAIQQERDKRLAKKMLGRLLSLPVDKWLYFGKTFNCWEFPIEFYDLIPKWWSIGASVNRALIVLSLATDEINKRFNNKEQLRFHNVSSGNMTDAEFEYFYENVAGFKNDAEKYYNRRFKMDEVKWWEDDVFAKIEKLELFNQS